MKVATAPFTGTCKKELAGKVILYSESRAVMASQWIKFESAVYNAAGKVDAALARAIGKKEPLTLADFLAPDTDYSDEYTTKKIDGTLDVNEKKKALYDKAEELLVTNSVTNYGSYLKSWETFFFRIKAQIDPETTSRVEMSDEWNSVKSKTNAGGLMRLIQTVCVHGTDRDYIPERVINCFATLLNSKQGKSTPSEFSEAMSSNHQVLIDVLGVNVFGEIPILQEFVIDKYSDLTFKAADLKRQDVATKKIVAERCVECILGCNMTLRSNKERSDMNAEVHKSLLSKHGDAFAMNPAEAVDQMIGYEALKKTNPIKKQTGDTSSAFVLHGFSDQTPEFRCWNCGEKGHSQYKCPELSIEQRQALYSKDFASKNTSDKAGAATKINKSVLFQTEDAVSDEEEEEEDDVIYIDDWPCHEDESGEIVQNEFIGCQINDEEEISFSSDETGDYPATLTSSDAGVNENEDQHRNEIIRVLTNVAVAQQKNNPSSWANAVAFKLGLVGVTTVTLLHVSLPNLNSRLHREGHSTLHNTTIGGLKVEVARATRGDKTVVQDFCQGHA